MEAKTFIAKKHETALEELRAIEAEYLPKMEAAKAAIALTKKLLDELSMEKTVAAPAAKVEEKPVVMVQEVARLTVVQGIPETAPTIDDFVKRPSEQWVSARDLQARVRQAS